MISALSSEKLRRHYDFIAWFYDWSDWFLETFRYRKLRAIVWSYARGSTLDLGMGTGLNIPYYPYFRLEKIVGVDISQKMLDRARAKANYLGVSLEIHQMDASDLNFPAGSFDTVISTFLFCVLPDEDQVRALSEVHRVLKPGGRFICMEYTYSRDFLRRCIMKILSYYVHWLYKAGFDRRTAELVKQNGNWKIDQDTYIYKDIIKLIVAEKLP